ncbi:MAG: 23S rRNA (adenine(2030)-N(6))-methyltransferase RlmJ, partial [Rhizobiales bacterium]|nr:23S rRNA (adenine(2030)-N(6))-methyltransferase RlmJ [Hyphomicrobiales bacterium]
GPLVATGLLILNPPFTLEQKLTVLLPYLAARFALGAGANSRIVWLTGERVTSA